MLKLTLPRNVVFNPEEEEEFFFLKKDRNTTRYPNPNTNIETILLSFMD